jgi:hypothetical protein
MTTLTQPLTSKRCCTCKQLLEVNLFGKDRSRADGLQARCKSCTRQIKKKYNPLAQRTAQLKHLYGITPEEYSSLLEKQGHQCAICRTDSCQTGRAFSVDHCHSTGKVRGLLCQSCNTALGKFNDDIERIHKAIRYLEASQPTHT